MNISIKKCYYGDFGGDSEKTSSYNNTDAAIKNAQEAWPLWEIFIRSKQGLDHKHAGSLHAADANMAMENARDVYTRRQEGVSIWVVESKHIHASNPDDAAALYEPAADKIYRHPTFYEIPDEVGHM
ncbi:1,2-phenylacetyl-CoA epoxidase subunit PaaB [Ferruginibacter yonginensis]|uniref:1,2-phenylacetyl-CoA epoxidase subunit PaaB n=1 Tax=Ferruginibacter yonginensis TaxID=1310416 RepID=A0ABV8QRF4_9BACT